MPNVDVGVQDRRAIIAGSAADFGAN